MRIEEGGAQAPPFSFSGVAGILACSSFAMPRIASRSRQGWLRSRRGSHPICTIGMTHNLVQNVCDNRRCCTILEFSMRRLIPAAFILLAGFSPAMAQDAAVPESAGQVKLSF